VNASELLPQVYAELRRLVAGKMAGEPGGQTLDATALVHEAYLRLGGDRSFESRSHYLRVAAQAMRRILIDHARARKAEKRGGDRERVGTDDLEAPHRSDDLLDLDEALKRLAEDDPSAAQVVELHHFAGLSHDEVAQILGITVYQARQQWNFARAWLKVELMGP
jgi:RNA polymerase sigma factor (TIGR02999 family)